MKLKRQSPHFPAADARLGDKVLWWPPIVGGVRPKRWDGRVTELGLLRVARRITVEFPPPNKRSVREVKEFDVNPLPDGVVIVPPPREVRAVDPRGKLRRYARANSLIIARDPVGGDDPVYTLVHRQTGIAVTAAVEEWHRLCFHRGRFLATRTKRWASVTAGTDRYEVPEHLFS